MPTTAWNKWGKASVKYRDAGFRPSLPCPQCLVPRVRRNRELRSLSLIVFLAPNLAGTPRRYRATYTNHLLRRCTYAGRPFGEEDFVARLENHFQRKWRRWSFEKDLDNGMLA